MRSPLRISRSAVPGVLGSLALLGLLYVHLRLHAYAHDDAYIHFRIVRHMLTHGVPYFNPAASVMASSSPGWPILLWLPGRLLPAPDLPLLAALLNAAATFCGALVYARLLARLTSRPPSLRLTCAFFAAYVALTIHPSLGLMETAMALLIAGLALHLLLNKSRWALLLFGVAPFFRPELIVLTGLALLYASARRIYPLRESVSFLCLGALPFVAYDLYFFGAVLPHTIRAKSLVYVLTFQESLGVVLTRLLDLLAPPGLFGFLGAWRPVCLFYALALVLMGVAAGFWERWKQRRAEWLGPDILILAWGAATLAGYLAARALIFQWYDPLFTVPILLVWGRSWVDGGARRIVRALRWLAFPLLGNVALILGQVVLAAALNPAYAPEFDYGARARHYLRIGEELAARCPDARLLTPEIGALGYTFDGEIVDALGLVSPEALRYHPMAVPAERSHGGVGAVPVGLVAETSPDLIVAYDIFVEAFLRSAVAARYIRIERPLFLPDDAARRARLHPETELFWASRGLNIFVRADSPCREAWRIPVAPLP